ncbi:FxSxx-COOH protein [Kitasatospora sp. YST-16]|uniref:FxSxx-COOH cyclophane-containing RiPP peptide n=1 Tax=Kitasatospora sp. YST-16 TaxID=2998080 RepID=UPI0022838095|nr:FxSxx-COOH cyclophane-containing RiPP peptide [Kitasatospora sp. YST-16]WAL73367.1 FxSxx-COOH protein [Kitasatospora sp. YST-16]WNW39423.1 FxSxx-COOH cyclophane-containing RiPP peptide [Streptomyces sp. Li-HN-5-13]
MTTALATDLSEPQVAFERAALADLAALDAEDLTAQIERVLPTAAARQVAVAAFQSSI